MIIPVSRSDKLSSRGKAAAITLLISAFCYLLLVLAKVPQEETDRSVYREVDLASFLPPEPPSFEEEVQEEEVEEQEVVEELPLQQPAESTPSLEQLDLSAFLPDQLEVQEPVSAPETPRTDANVAEDIGLETNDNALAGLGSLDALDQFGADPGLNARGRAANQRGTSGGEGLSIASGSRQLGSGQLDQPIGGANGVIGESSSRADVAANADTEVPRFSLEDFGDDYESLEIRDLIAWMKQNPGDLPIGVRQLVRHQPAFLTSATAFRIDGKAYQLFLMCKESLNEVHIVLVDVDDATYLVDRSFQKMSTLFREGSVQRSLSEEIIAVNSRRNSASDARSKEFYGLFLSWWEQAKQEVQ